MITIKCTLSEWLARGPGLVRAGAEAVEIENPSPEPVPVNSKTHWWWRAENGDFKGLPPDLMKTLTRTGEDVAVVSYRSEEDAKKALNQAALAWAKSATN